MQGSKGSGRADAAPDSTQKLLAQRTELLQQARKVLHSEMQARHRAELRAALESAVVRVLVGSQSFPETLPTLLKAVCLGAGWDVGEFWTFDDSAQALRWGGLFSKDAATTTEPLRKASEAGVLPAGRGSPWRVWTAGKPLWGTAANDDISSSRSSALRKLGLSTSLSLPFHGGEGTAGVLTLYRKEAQSEQAEEIDYIQRVLHQVARLGNWKWGEGAQQLLESRVRAFVEAYPLPALVYDRNGRIRFSSGAARDLLGHGPLSAVRTINDLPRALSLYRAGTQDPYPVEKLPVSRALGGESSHADDIELRREGTHLFLESYATPLRGPDEKVEYAIVVVVDITHAREQQHELEKAREEALAADRAKSDFVSRMSHEIRTPLNAILGSNDLLWETPLTQDQQEYVRLCREAGQGLMSLISNILDLSRVEAGKLELAATPFGLEEFVEKTMSMFSLRAHQKKLELSSLIEDGVPETVVGDPVRLRQVLVNLIGNAIKFTEKGGITVRVRVEPGSKDPGRLRFSVKDTGIGIPADRKDAVFERFVQASATTAAEYGGSGLGLTISKHLVETMGGKIWVESTPGEGSLFSFTVPLKVAPGSTLHTARPDLSGVRALVIDASEEDRQSLHTMLEDQGVSVSLAEAGKEGLAEFDRARQEGLPYGLVVLADQLAEGPSWTTARGLVDRGASAQIIFLSRASQTKENAPRLRELGISHELTKPVDRGSVLALAASTLRGVKLLPRPGRGAAKAAPAPTPQLEGLRVLVAEDSEDNRFILQRFLRNTACRVELAENGKVALDMFTRGEYDLVLMDLQMPFMDGFTATRSIREWEKRRGATPTPIIALSAYAIKEEVDRSLAAGCDAHVTKPIDKAKLLQILGTYGKKATA